ncbi:MAG: acetolactate synthase [Planctomycetaceae bacterium]|nr:acetolactate synthase [Planctomycetaceae bacterium]
MSIRGANLVIRSLARAGVERVFALSGNHIMSLFDACLDEGIEIIHVRHEAAAVHMADAVGRLTGKPAVALVTAGPGFANTLSAQYVTSMAESPLVLLSGAAPSTAPAGLGFQAMPQEQMAGHVSKASWAAQDIDRLGHDVARAFRLSQSGRPGPVYLSLPVNLLESETERNAGTLPVEDDFHPIMDLLDTQMARQCLALISSAERPLIITGPACCHSDGHELMGELTEKLGVPVVAMQSPRGINDPSLGAFAEVLSAADLLVLIGKKTDFTLKLARPPFVDSTCRIIQFAPEIGVLEQTNELLEQTGQFVLADVAGPRACLERLLQVGETSADQSDWLTEVQSAIGYRPDEWPSIDTATTSELHPVQVGRAINEFLQQEKDAIFVSDGGEFGQWMQACANTARCMINGPAGSIGGSLPMAIGAAIDSEETVLATLGDGTMGFHPAEFETAVRHNARVIAVVGNDSRWNSEHQIQLREYGEARTHSCNLSAVDYASVAASFGARGFQVNSIDELQAALHEANQTDGPSCIDVKIESVAAPIIRRA